MPQAATNEIEWLHSAFVFIRCTFRCIVHCINSSYSKYSLLKKASETSITLILTLNLDFPNSYPTWFSPLRGVASDETRQLYVALSGATEESALSEDREGLQPSFHRQGQFLQVLILRACAIEHFKVTLLLVYRVRFGVEELKRLGGQFQFHIHRLTSLHIHTLESTQ